MRGVLGRVAGLCRGAVPGLEAQRDGHWPHPLPHPLPADRRLGWVAS